MPTLDRVRRAPSWPIGALLLLGALAGAPAGVGAHGAAHEVVEALTIELATRPTAPDLYLARAELYRLDRRFAEAAADLERAAALAPAHPRLDLARAALALDTGDVGRAEVLATRAIVRDPGLGESWLLRSRAREAVGRGLEAADDMDRAIAALARPEPDHYLLRAALLVRAGRGQLERARAGLEEGIRRLGPAISLERAARDLERAYGPPGATRPGADASFSRGAAVPTPGAAGRPGPAGDAPPAGSPASAQVTRGPYLQLGTPNGVTVRWRTDVATNSRVRWGSVPGALLDSVDLAPITTEHEVAITSLSPDTRYYYSVGSTSGVLAGGDLQHTFVSAPPAGAARPVRAWIIGDSGLNNQWARDVLSGYLAHAASHPADLWLMLGDNAYSTGTDAEYQGAVFEMYPDLLRTTVLWPTRGNHDFVYAGANNDYYDIFTLPTAAEAGGLPSGSEAYYAFDYGPVHFVCLDSEGSNRSVGGAMAVWLRADLAATAQSWIVVYFHHPPYTKGSHDSDNAADSGGRMRDMRQNVLPILDSTGVDLVLTGHSHSYERSFLLKQHYGLSTTLHDSMKVDSGDGRPDGDGAYAKPTPAGSPFEGAVYVVAGSSSQTGGGGLNHPVMITSQNVLGSLVLDVDRGQLDARFIGTTGAVLDSFTILKGGTVDAPAGIAGASGLRLGNPAPNPFRGDLRIGYRLPGEGRSRLTVHGVDGRRIATLHDAVEAAGAHETRWDGRDDRGRPVPPGVYFGVLEFAGEKRAVRIVRLK